MTTMYEIRLGDKCYVKDVFEEHMIDYLTPTPRQVYKDAWKARLQGKDNSPIAYCGIERSEIGAWPSVYEGKDNQKEIDEACQKLLKDCPNNVPELTFIVYNE